MSFRGPDVNAREVVVPGLKAALTAHREGRVFDIGNGWDEAASLDCGVTLRRAK
jgi:hypothetical protein